MYLPSAPFGDDCAGCGDVFACIAGKYPAVDLPVRRFLFTSSTSKILDSVLARKVLGLLIESLACESRRPSFMRKRWGQLKNLKHPADEGFIVFVDC